MIDNCIFCQAKLVNELVGDNDERFVCPNKYSELLCHKNIWLYKKERILNIVNKHYQLSIQRNETYLFHIKTLLVSDPTHIPRMILGIKSIIIPKDEADFDKKVKTLLTFG